MIHLSGKTWTFILSYYHARIELIPNKQFLWQFLSRIIIGLSKIYLMPFLLKNWSFGRSLKVSR